MRDFDKAAATWDDEPRRVKLARDVAACIAGRIALHPGMDVLDFGCGTGLLALDLQPLVRSVTGVDSSGGMLEVLGAKAASLALTNVTAVHRDLERGDLLEGSHHLITSSMTLHHIRDIGALLSEFSRVLLPSGHIAIADLDLDGGRFHDDGSGVFHDGFSRGWLADMLESAGFEGVSCETATSVTKEVAGGGEREFTVFLMTGRKR